MDLQSFKSDEKAPWYRFQSITLFKQQEAKNVDGEPAIYLKFSGVVKALQYGK